MSDNLLGPKGFGIDIHLLALDPSRSIWLGILGREHGEKFDDGGGLVANDLCPCHL